MNAVSKAGEECLSTIEMFVRLDKLANRPEQKSQVVFHARQMAGETGLLEAKACSSVFHQCEVDVIRALFCCTKALEHKADPVMEFSLERLVSYFFKQGCRLIVNAQRV